MTGRNNICSWVNLENCVLWNIVVMDNLSFRMSRCSTSDENVYAICSLSKVGHYAYHSGQFVFSIATISR
jgi:hypothetical protein